MCSDCLYRALLVIAGTQAGSEAYALLCTLALDCQSVSALIWCHVIVECFF